MHVVKNVKFVDVVVVVARVKKSLLANSET